MRILSVVWGFPRADQPFIADKLIRLVERGHEVEVLCAPGDPALTAELRRRSSGALKIRPVLSEHPPGPTALARLVAAATRRDTAFTRRVLGGVFSRVDRGPDRRWTIASALAFAGCRPDVIHFEFANWAASFAAAMPLLEAPILVTCHGSDVRIAPLGDDDQHQRLRRMFELVDRVICVSGDLAEATASFGVEPTKVVRLGSGVDTGYFASTSSRRRLGQPGRHRIRLLSVGRLHWVKGYEYGLTALRLLCGRGHDVEYTIVGDDRGEGAAAVRLAIADMGLGSRVTLAGPCSRDQVRARLADADLFVLPSVSEGLNTATLEAMAMGVPVVVTAVGGMREVVLDGHTGIVVPARDPVALADAVERLILDPQAGLALAAAGLDHVRRLFDAGLETDRLIAVYEDLVAARPVRPTKKSEF